MTIETIEWIGSFGGIAGALILALNRPWSGWGYPVFLVFTGLLLLAAAWRGSGPHMALFGAYTAVNALGVYRWLLRPRKGPSTRP